MHRGGNKKADGGREGGRRGAGARRAIHGSRVSRSRVSGSRAAGSRAAGSRAAAGKVYLVGAGPGDPELLTVRAARLIEAADDIVVDALVPPAIYSGVRARVIYVGKRAGHSHTPQRRIEAILIALARDGRCVVRLKGGDPCVFGRVAEELDALAAAGVPCDVVPGISSAIAAPAAVGIAVTERGVADRLTIVTGHQRAAPGGQDDPVPEVPPYDAGQTVVVLMGLGHLETWVARLLRAGYPPDLPAAAISHATLATQRHVAASLAAIVQVARSAALAAPVTFVFGGVAARADATMSRLGGVVAAAQTAAAAASAPRGRRAHQSCV